jgi:8-amino-7-oxononanoate synthase
MFISELANELNELKHAGIHRKLKQSSGSNIETTINNKKVLTFCSNDYLNLSCHPEVIKAANEAALEFGAGSSASRLISGNLSLYDKLENKLASFKKTEDALVFSSGYLTNIGVISSFAGRNDIIFCDKLSHASIIDACVLSRAKVVRFNHNDIEDLTKKIKNTTIVCNNSKKFRSLIVTEGLFSMDGDLAPLNEISKIAKENDCLLIVDDAHGTGVLGENGRGTAEFYNCANLIDVQIGTLSKAIGSLGGFVVLPGIFKDYLINRSRSFIFTTALPPATLASAIKSIELIENSRNLRDKLAENWSYLRQGLLDLGFKTLSRTGPIIPVLIGDSATAVKFSEKLFDKGIFVPAIRPPAVEHGKSRLRITVSSAHKKNQIDKLLKAMSETGKELGLVE